MIYKILKWFLISSLAFGLIYLIHNELLAIFNISDKDKTFVQLFYYFLTLLSAVMILNIFIVYFFKTKFVGYTFLIWSMLKIILVMVFFIVFALLPRLKLDDNSIFYIMSLYFLYLFYEVILGVALLKQKIPTHHKSRNLFNS